MAAPRSALVTGATSGIGLEAARAIARSGWSVLVGARDEGRGGAVVDELARAGNGGSAELFVADLASLASVRAAAERFLASGRPLHVLVNNAGVVSRERLATADGHEVTWQTNFLSGFLLTRLLLPALKSAPGARVVNVSSRGHFNGRIEWDDPDLASGYSPLRAYGQSKLAQVLFTRELARREPTLAVNAVHPGAIGTKIWDAAPRAIAGVLKAVLPSAARGARPVVRLAIDPALDGVSGRYFDRMREAPPSAAAQREADAARLWALAARATGLSD